MIDKIINIFQQYRLYFRGPIHVHSLSEHMLMSVKQCVVCRRVVEAQDYEKLTTEAPQQPESLERDNVPYEAKKPSDRSYEAQVRDILSKHGVLTHDGWQFITDELVNDLAQWKRGSRAK